MQAILDQERTLHIVRRLGNTEPLKLMFGTVLLDQVGRTEARYLIGVTPPLNWRELRLAQMTKIMPCS